ncbi:DUF1836 domain-containing protein [Raoultibacter phocaeensis]|uniref:DUF1836 domain-containing protein n=1 Tax=Raoultibacter phocaeensis TaxID=2479841 RepID=UPI00111A4249|nr:DUF1836 domain-containing protein [Raoultibacter phocaeensis]
MVSVARTAYAAGLKTIALPRFDEIPRIELYMDQLLGYLEETLRPLYSDNEKIITSSMVNNYVKQGILAATHSKRYTRNHIAYLIVICTLKQTFSIAEIERLIASQIASFDTAVAYDYYCSAFENAVKALFGDLNETPRGLIGTSNEGDFERDLVLASTAAVAYTLYIKASLIAMEPESE